MVDYARSQPTVAISRRGAERLRAGHVWVYRSDVVEARDVEPGALVTVQEVSGGSGPGRPLDKLRAGSARAGAMRTLGIAFYSTSSEIAIRMISAKPVGDLDELIRERIRGAVAYRARFVRDTDAYRVIFSEADFLPGLIVDRYCDILSMQVLTQAMDRGDIREVVMSELRELLKPAAIVERVDPRVRKLEQLSEKESGVIWEGTAEAGGAVAPRTLSDSDSSHPAPDPGPGGPGLQMTGLHKTGLHKIESQFQMNGVRFLYDALEGQKTGAFLDQRENYAAAAQYARGEALDVFCYQGGFALHLPEKCSKVTGVDSSRPALEMAEKNAALNGREIDWIEANAFDLLRDYADVGRKYDCIVLDPPAFAKSRQNLATALSGYKELNLRALKMLRPGGILVSCSCSYHVSASDLLGTISTAALDSHRIIRLLENRGQAKDHPIVLGIPETAYLKCLIIIVS
jgi:23S rRNA (cytosine1962-C5)-methyltransferase